MNWKFLIQVELNRLSSCDMKSGDRGGYSMIGINMIFENCQELPPKAYKIGK